MCTCEHMSARVRMCVRVSAHASAFLNLCAHVCPGRAQRVGRHTPRMETLLRNFSYILRFLSVLPCGEETEKQVFRGLRAPAPPTFSKSPRDPEPLKGGPRGVPCPTSPSSEQGSEGLPPRSPDHLLPPGSHTTHSLTQTHAGRGATRPTFKGLQKHWAQSPPLTRHPHALTSCPP